ncbi:hypothetical protein [Leifsonia poae]|uniref:hypothetical protein n=1 Tax=Leifsonia poae TaxID=110933 RepID=UPI001CBD7AAA|nr:hypothetical protein [Leifsonia poae]
MAAAPVTDFDPLFFRPCIFPILGELGYGTSITINNALVGSPFSTNLDVSISFLSDAGERLGVAENIMTLQPGEVRKIDTRDIIKELQIPVAGNTLGVAHLVPERFRGQGLVTVDRAELMAHVSASDDFIEFRQEPRGVITGVAYQMGPQNDSRFNKTRTTLLQAPKAIVSPTVDTLFALINASTTFDYTGSAHMEYWLVDPSGKKIAKGVIEVPAWGFRFISVRQLLVDNGLLDSFIAQGGLGMVLGLSRDAGLVPLSMTRNLVSGGIACDHTLPPIYYFTTWGGQKRIETNEILHRTFFETAATVLPTSEGALERA